MTKEEWIEKLTKEGFGDFHLMEMGPNSTNPEHTHELQAVHIALQGDVTVTDKDGVHPFKEGDRMDFPAGTVHSGVFGPEGCVMLVGTKK